MSQPSPAEMGISQLPRLVARLAFHPVGVMQGRLSLTWGSIFTLQAATAILSGAVVAATEKSWLDFAISLFVFPLTMIMIVAIFTLLLYYYFALFVSTYLDPRHLHAVVAVATVPYFVLHSFSGFLPPIDLLGFAAAAILCIVGLVEQFSLGKRPIFTFFIFAGLIFFAVWSAVQYTVSA